jgi:hypothetical protein
MRVTESHCVAREGRYAIVGWPAAALWRPLETEEFASARDHAAIKMPRCMAENRHHDGKAEKEGQ